MAGPILQAARRARLALWLGVIRVRLRRHGVRLELALGHNVRFAGRPRLDLDMDGARPGGTLHLSIGADTRIGRDLVLDVRPGSDHVLELADGCLLQDHVRLQLRGGAIRLAECASLRDFCELKSAGELTLGVHAICGRNVTLHCAERIAIGARAGLGERSTVTDSDHIADGSDTWFMAQPIRIATVDIGANAWVGTNAVLLRGVTLGANAVVAAGAVVNGTDVPAGHMAAGVPARVVRDLRS